MTQHQLSLRVSFGDVVFQSLMVGLGETYIVAFALALGFSERSSGLIATLPTLIGAVVQLISPWVLGILGSQRRWVMICACLQSIALLGLAFLGYRHFAPSSQLNIAVFAIVTLYWSGSMSLAPSWNSWIAGIIPENRHTYFFAFRTRIAQFFTLLGLSTAGIWLHQMVSPDSRVTVFSGLFTAAAIFRLISISFLRRLPEGPHVSKGSGWLQIFSADGLRWLKERRTIVIILFLGFTQFAVNISGPYYSAYMLKHLKLDYQHYMILLSASFVARIIAGGWFQKLATTIGPTSLTHIGALLVIPSPFFWIFGGSFPYLVLLQIFTGIAWGCHELGVTLMLINKQNHEERARLLTITTVLNATMMCCGSAIGYSLLSNSKLDSTHYFMLFTLSALLRCIPLMILPKIGDSRIKIRPWLVGIVLRR